jgi:flavin reductase (DIM6/NTAB) family NADH-FMN oxidoreductase RutF
MTATLTPIDVLPCASDLDTFWEAGLRFTTGVSVITLGTGDEVCGATVSTFSMVSRRPALISLCLSTSSGLTDLVLEHRSFTVNILSRGQEEVARHFERPTLAEGSLIPGALCWLWCQFRRVVPAGDHQIVLAGVTAAQLGAGRPLLSFGGRLHAGTIKDSA